MRLGLILNRSIKDSNLRSGKLPVFACPNAPEQNPIENIWLQGKRLLRECYHLCQNFSTVKFLFEFVTHLQTFDPSFILMAVSHNSFRLLYRFSVTLGE